MPQGRWLLLTLTMCLGVARSLSADNPVTWADLATLRQINYLQVSPNGQQVAYVMAGEVWIGTTRAGSVPKSIGNGNVPTCAEDSERAAFYSSQSGSQQLWVWNARSGALTQITSIAGGISPDRRAGRGGSVNDFRICRK